MAKKREREIRKIGEVARTAHPIIIMGHHRRFHGNIIGFSRFGFNYVQTSIAPLGKRGMSRAFI